MVTLTIDDCRWLRSTGSSPALKRDGSGKIYRNLPLQVRPDGSKALCREVRQALDPGIVDQQRQVGRNARGFRNEFRYCARIRQITCQ